MPHVDADDVVITIDVEWAHAEVLRDTVSLLDERGLRATFFCTHEGIDVGGHERALHPNFRRSRNSLVSEDTPRQLLASDEAFYGHVVDATRAWYPEAVGVRSHNLIWASDLPSIYREAGLQYDSSCMLPFADHLTPVWKGSGMLELPIFYMDFWDLSEGATGFDPDRLPLEGPGLRVLDFHPNLIYLNATTLHEYAASRPHYHDPGWLLARRRPGRGVRTMFLHVLDALAKRGAPPVLGDINARWRSGPHR